MLLAVALPPLFVHETYQPSWSVALGSTTATMYLSDLAILVVGGAAIGGLARHGVGALRPARWLVAVAAALLVWILVATLYGSAVTEGYRFAKHAVTAAKYWEYALLALAVPVLARRAAERWLLVAAVVACSLAATVGGLLQFIGVVNELEGRRPGQREPSFVGIHDFAALSGATLTVAFALLAVGHLARSRERTLVATAALSGTVGLALSGAAAGVLGVLAAIVVAALAGRARGTLSLGRVAALGGLAAASVLGVLAMRSVDFKPALSAIGVDVKTQTTRAEAESYRQRSVLAYIGVRTFLDHPLAGVGWQGTSEEAAYGPYLADARERFPAVPARAFPSPAHAWGVQNAFLQAAADLGLPGLILFVGLFLAAGTLAARALGRAPPREAPFALLPILWVCVTMGVWSGLGLVAGIPLVALQWLAIGLAASSAGLDRSEHG